MFLLVVAALLAIVAYYKWMSPKKKDYEVLSQFFLDKDWSLNEEAGDLDQVIRRFEIKIPTEEIEILQDKLKSVRWPEPSLKTSEFRYGVRDDYMKELVGYWKNEYSWKKQEDWMNSFDHFKTKIEGLNIHYIHAKPKMIRKGVEPHVILMTHGWPGSVVEFMDILPMLTDPANYEGNEVDTFTVICPSIPGYGFSDAPQKEGFNAFHCARVFHKLMLRLGYKKYYLQGGDWGSYISTAIAMLYPSNIKGIHTTLNTSQPRGINFLKLIVGAYFPSLFFYPDEAAILFPLKKAFIELLQETGYMHLQATKPDTVGFALSDSPVGLAAYIVEKFSSWTDIKGRNHNDGLLSKYWNKDKLLNNVMIYWWNNNITSSMRFYKENLGPSALRDANPIVVRVPAAFAHFPNEFIGTSKLAVQQKFSRLLQYTLMKRGGHFSAYEVPADLTSDIRLFIRTVQRLEREERAAEIEARDVGVSQLDRMEK
uniref:Epoxide hydrolase n=1 Tax=Phallusia mammillata TaxID=59560 RepID=A0A6F9DCM3_9ASCI|nr:epoxide hydrolase 1-like [Phallusia mammillata]